MPTNYADNAWHGPVAVEENATLARDTYRIRIVCPEIARRVLPGQFLMLRLPGESDPLLGRPLALYDVVPGPDGQPRSIDIVYVALGKMTRLLTGVKVGATIEAWGPLGNGFPLTPTEHLLMVAGGIGQTPFLALARAYLGLHTYGDPPREVVRAEKVSLCYGVRSREFFAGVDEFRRAGVSVHLSTDDGTEGHHGMVTDLVVSVARETTGACRIVGCGPEQMMKATAEIAHELGVPCQLSLESPMACGIGVCFSCVKKIRDGSGSWDYRRTCVEGPVFDAADIEF